MLTAPFLVLIIISASIFTVLAELITVVIFAVIILLPESSNADQAKPPILSPARAVVLLAIVPLAL